MTTQAYQIGGSGSVTIPSSPIYSSRSPSTTDIISPNGNPYQIGQFWKNTASNLLFEYAGRGVWIDIINSDTGNFPITSFVVGPLGQAGFQTIQSAINAASVEGGGTVYIQPGTYNENLTLQSNVNLIGFAGSLGDVGYYVNSNYQCSVVVNGSYTLDTSSAPDPTFNTCENIQFSPPTGDVITFNSNAAGIIASTLNLINCTLIGTQVSKSILAMGGFPIINLYNCTLDETTNDTIDVVSLPFADSGQFINLNAFNTHFGVNNTSACVIPDGSDIHFYLNDCFYGSMLDLTSNTTGFFSIDSRNTIFGYTGSATLPLFNFGNCPGSVSVTGGIYTGGSGGFSSSQVVSSDSFWVIQNVYFSNTLIVANNCKDKYINCFFFTGSSPAITMSATTDVTFAGCVVDSSNNPAITGAGAGTLYLGDITFLNNSSSAGALTLGYRPSRLGATLMSGNLTFGTTGNKITTSFAATTTTAGANAFGTSALVAGTATVNTTAVTANSIILLSIQVLGTVATAKPIAVTARVAATSFTITSADNTDTSTVGWMIIN
jgi:hypothetical protein